MFFSRHHNLINRYGIFVSPMTMHAWIRTVCRNTIKSFSHSVLVTGFVTREIGQVSLVEQELFTLPEHLFSSPLSVWGSCYSCGPTTCYSSVLRYHIRFPRKTMFSSLYSHLFCTWFMFYLLFIFIFVYRCPTRF